VDIYNYSTSVVLMLICDRTDEDVVQGLRRCKSILQKIKLCMSSLLFRIVLFLQSTCMEMEVQYRTGLASSTLLHGSTFLHGVDRTVVWSCFYVDSRPVAVGGPCTVHLVAP
jgi:hypothetical protein